MEQTGQWTGSIGLASPDRAAFLTTYGPLESSSSREAGPAFDTQLTDQEMKELAAWLDPALTPSYTADSSSEDAGRADEVAYVATVDSEAPAAPTPEFLRLNLIGGETFDTKTRALLEFLTELQRRTYERGVQVPAGGPRPSWSLPRAYISGAVPCDSAHVTAHM